MIGSTIGNYKILEQLNGTDTTGVYKAVDLLLNRNVYIKIPSREFMNQPDIAESFRFEAATLAKIVHPNVPTLHSLTKADERLLMVTEFLEGEMLEKVLRRQGKLSSEKAISIFTQVLDCLEFAHTAGIAHGNLKTNNIFLTENDGVKILGFGTTENLRISDTDGNILPEISPEAKSATDNDIFAVGKILFAVLTGENLHSDDLSEAEQQLREINPAIPEKVLEIVNNIFRLQVYGKFQSAAELHREFLTFDTANTDSAIITNTEFFGRSGNKSAAEYSVDFSQDENKVVETALQQIRKKARNEKKTSANAPFNWKLAQKNLWVGGAGILAIVVLHFFFQFSFFSDDSVRVVRELTETGHISEVELSIESEPPIIEIETANEIDPFVNQNTENPAEPVIEYEEVAETKAKKVEVVKKPEIVSPPVQSKSKAAPPRKLLKKKEPQETRAERLRRAEKMLTGA